MRSSFHLVLILILLAMTSCSAAALSGSLASGALLHNVCAFNAAPPHPSTPVSHWPWWLRLLALVGVLIFIRFVASAIRQPGPGAKQ